MKYINQLEIINKGFEAENKELRNEINELKNIYLPMARGARDYNEKLLFAEQKKNKELESKLAEAERQIKQLKKTINSLTKENKQQETSTNADLQNMILNGLSFLTKAMEYNQNSI